MDSDKRLEMFFYTPSSEVVRSSLVWARHDHGGICPVGLQPPPCRAVVGAAPRLIGHNKVEFTSVKLNQPRLCLIAAGVTILVY